jgi:hypothetical protein
VSDTPCTAGDCPKPAYKDGLCSGHYTRRRRGQPLTPLAPRQGWGVGAKDPHDRLKDAAIAYSDAVDQADYDKQWENLVDAAEWVALGVPKIPRLQRLGYRLLSELRAKMREALKGNEAPMLYHGDAHRGHR